MHMPPKHQFETGLTGRFRFRQQPFTGKPVFEVEVSIAEARYPGETPTFIRNQWRDATMHEANAYQMRMDIKAAGMAW